MNIFVSGINYKTTPLNVREKLSFSNSEQKKAIEEIMKIKSINECIMLSTCNRTEVYIYSDSCVFDNEGIEKLLLEMKGLNLYEYKKYFYFYSSVKSAQHLFKVACGLDSMVIGEDQILAQVKDAHGISLFKGTSSGILNTLFREAITAAKEVKTYTNISKNSISVASLSIKLISELFNSQMENKCALVIGAGEIGSIALKNLISSGIQKIYVTNRTHGKAADISKFSNSIQVIDYNSRYSVIDECDIIISSTTSPHYTITRDMVKTAITSVKERVFIDLAVPRDIDVSINELDGIKYFNMDDLQLTVDKNIDKRLLEVTKAEEIIDKAVADFEKWYEFRAVLPVIKEIQRYSEGVLNEKISRTLSKLKCASDEDREIVKASITGIVNEILNKFIYSIKENGSKEDVETYFKCIAEVFKN
jgi:glutamyl-tRNA reductase